MCMDDASGELVNRCKPVRNNIVSVTGTEREGGGAERVGGLEEEKEEEEEEEKEE